MPEQAAYNIADYAVDLVAALGSTTCFTLTGGMAMYLNRAVASHPELTAVYCQHEQACVAAAEGYAKASNFRKAGFAVVTAGPGVSNSVTPLLSAYGDSTPLIVLAGQIKSADIDTFGTRTHGIQEIDSAALINPCVKRFTRLKAEGYRDELVWTVAEAFAGRPGPVFIEIPLDVQGVQIPDSRVEVACSLATDFARIRYANSSRVDVTNFGELWHRRIPMPSPSEEEDAHMLASCLALLLKAERPLLYMGNGCRIAGGCRTAGVENTVREFIARHNIPAVFSWLSFDMMPFSDPLNFGCPGGLAPLSANEILSRADTIVFLGARLDLATTAFQRESFGSQAFRYFVDIDPRELSKFAGFERTKCVLANLRALPKAIERGSLMSRESAADASWLARCQSLRESYLTEERQRMAIRVCPKCKGGGNVCSQTGLPWRDCDCGCCERGPITRVACPDCHGKLNCYGVAKLLSRWSDAKIFVSASSGYAEETFTRFFEPGIGTRFFNGAALGAMGLGLPHAIGAAFAAKRQVICIEADGGLMLNIQELATLAHYAPRGFVLFVLNNGGYESIRASQQRHFGAAHGVDRESGVYIPDFEGLANAFRISYVSVETLDELSAILPNLKPDNSPVIVDLKIERSEYRGPAVKTVIGEDGKPYTTPMSEMTW